MPKPTHQEASLMLQVVQWYTEIGMFEAASWVGRDDFPRDYATLTTSYPRGSQERMRLGKICAFLGFIGQLYQQGLLHEELLFDWLGAEFFWERLEGYVVGLRAATGNQRLYERFEALARAKQVYEARQA